MYSLTRRLFDNNTNSTNFKWQISIGSYITLVTYVVFSFSEHLQTKKSDQ